MMQWSCHWPGSFIISNTGGWQGELHSGGDRQQICNKHLVYLFNVFFMFLELLRTALNININFSYISIYASHLGTYWKSRLYFSVVLRPLSHWKWLLCAVIHWPLQKGWGCHSLRLFAELMQRQGWPVTTCNQLFLHSIYVVLLGFGIASMLPSASYMQPSH